MPSNPHLQALIQEARQASKLLSGDPFATQEQPDEATDSYVLYSSSYRGKDLCILLCTDVLHRLLHRTRCLICSSRVALRDMVIFLVPKTPTASRALPPHHLFSYLQRTCAPTHVHAPVFRHAGLPPGIFLVPNDIKCTLPPYHLSSPLQRTHTPTRARASHAMHQHVDMPTCQRANQCTNTPTRQHAKLQTMRLRTSDAPAHQCTTCRSVDMPTHQHANVHQCVHAQSPTRVPMHIPVPRRASAIESHTPGTPFII